MAVSTSSSLILDSIIWKERLSQMPVKDFVPSRKTLGEQPSNPTTRHLHYFSDKNALIFPQSRSWVWRVRNQQRFQSVLHRHITSSFESWLPRLWHWAPIFSWSYSFPPTHSQRTHCHCKYHLNWVAPPLVYLKHHFVVEESSPLRPSPVRRKEG